MTTVSETVFFGLLDTANGTKTANFQRADYAIITAPGLASQGVSLNIDAFLQLKFENGVQRLVPLDPTNTLDTNNISLVPVPFNKGHDKDMYLWLVSDQSFLVRVVIVYSTDDDIQEIKDRLRALEDSSGDIGETIETVIDVIRLLSGDVTSIIGLLEDLGSGTFLPPSGDSPQLPQAGTYLYSLQGFF